jgi:hypothetical protein
MFPLIRAICEAGKVAPRAALARQQSSVLSLVALCFLCVFVLRQTSAHAHTKGKPRQGETLRPVLGQRFQHRCVPSLHKVPEGQMDKLSSFPSPSSLSNKERRDGGEDRVRSFCVCSKRLSISSPLHLFGIIFFCDPIAGLQIPGCHTHAHTHRSCICKCIYLVQRAHARKKKVQRNLISHLSEHIANAAHISRSLLASEGEHQKPIH